PLPPTGPPRRDATAYPLGSTVGTGTVIADFERLTRGGRVLASTAPLCLTVSRADERGVVAAGRDQGWMPRLDTGLEQAQGALVEALCFLEAALPPADHRQVVERVRQDRIISADQLLLHSERPPVEQLCILVGFSPLE